VDDLVDVCDTVGEFDGVVTEAKLELRSKTDDEHEFKENIVAFSTFTKLTIGIGNRPKALANAAFVSPATPRLLSVTIAAEKLLSCVCTMKAKAGTSKFEPSGPAHSKVKLGSVDDALREMMRAPTMFVTLTTRASASAKTPS